MASTNLKALNLFKEIQRKAGKDASTKISGTKRTNQPKTNTTTITGARPKDGLTTEARNDILDLLLHNPNVTPMRLYRMGSEGLTLQTARKALYTLKYDGYAVCDQDGYWKVTDKGRQHLHNLHTKLIETSANNN